MGCKAGGKGKCQVFELVEGPPPEQGASSNSTGRRLAAYPGDDTPRMLMVFGEDAVMVCTEEGCGELLERSEGRRQLKLPFLFGAIVVLGTAVVVQQSCLPADAAVVTEQAGRRRMDELRVGDRVLAARPDGSTFYDDVYMFGHKDAAATGSFVKLETAGGAALRLTPDHHVFVTRAGARLEIPASAAQVGDLVQVVGAGGAAALDAIVAKTLAADRGLFNPYTLSGSIVVDGVAASCHSSSFMDGVFAALNIPLPAGYQAMYAPVRALYRLLGARRMAALDPIVDAVVAASNQGPAAVLAPFVASTCAVTAAAWMAAAKRIV